MFQKVLLLALAIIIAVPSVQADRRKYVWTYQTTTMAPDAKELEFYSTVKENATKSDSWEYKVELEQGISPKFDIAMYQIFTQSEGASLKWDAFQFRGRYRLGLPGEVAFDPVFYAEYRRKLENGSGQNKFEVKVLLGKDFGKTNISVNPVYEAMWSEGYKPYQEVGLDAGISYAPSFKFSIGLESTTRQYFYTVAGKENKYKTSFGPTISFATGDSYYTFGIAYGLNDKADDTQARFIMGIGL